VGFRGALRLSLLAQKGVDSLTQLDQRHQIHRCQAQVCQRRRRHAIVVERHEPLDNRRAVVHVAVAGAYGVDHHTLRDGANEIPRSVLGVYVVKQPQHDLEWRLGVGTGTDRTA
jgi:hypothetical protein